MVNLIVKNSSADAIHEVEITTLNGFVCNYTVPFGAGECVPFPLNPGTYNVKVVFAAPLPGLEGTNRECNKPGVCIEDHEDHDLKVEFFGNETSPVYKVTKGSCHCSVKGVSK